MPIDPMIFDLIRSNDVEERKKGVKALARTEDREALRYLASLHKQDPDAEVRHLALLAGQHIKKRNALGDWGHDSGKSAEKLAPVEYKTDGAKKKENLPSDANTTKAKALLDKAMDFVMKADYAEAQSLAYEAFAIAPQVANDAYYAGVAAEIMGVPQAEALAKLKAGQSDYDGDGKAKRKRGAKDGTPTWGEFFVDTAILFVASAASLIFFMVMLFNQIQGLADSGALATMGASYSEYGSFDATTEVMNFLANSGLSIALIVGFAGGLFIVLANLLHFFILHLCSSGFLGGVGSFRSLVHKAIIPLVIQSLVSVVITGITYYLTFQAIIDSGGNPNAVMLSSDTSGILNLLNGLSSLLGFVYTLWLSFIVGQNYDFGMGKGCGAMIISYIVIFAVSFCGGFTLVSMLAQA
jgi:hypothetical protein